ncbi:hypothetical protein GCM10009797_19190 [Nocardioides hwasunensis]
MAAGLAAAGVLGLSGCAGIGQPAPYDSPGINGLVIPTPTPDPSDFTDAVDNPWLPLAVDATWRYDVTGAGRTIGTIDAEVVDGTTDVAGLSATAVLTRTTIEDRTSAVTRFYAQDVTGNVWLVGEDLDGIGWRAGTDGAEAGLAMPADPRLGDGWRPYVVPGLPGAGTTIDDQSASMLQTSETGTGVDGDEAGTTTRNVYERGVGLVGVEDLDAGWTARLVGQSGS